MSLENGRADPVAVARACWKAAGRPMPEWVAALAAESAATSQNRVAERMGRSAALVSQVLRAKYPGDLQAVEEVFNGAFRAAVLECPALGTIPTNVCRDWRVKSRRLVNVNAQRVAMFRACSACPRNRGGEP
jgi:hypothetical protein